MPLYVRIPAQTPLTDSPLDANLLASFKLMPMRSTPRPRLIACPRAIDTGTLPLDLRLPQYECSIEYTPYATRRTEHRRRGPPMAGQFGHKLLL